MKFCHLILFICISAGARPQLVNSIKQSISPLAMYSEEWNKPIYNSCNTASDITYMNEKEKEVIYILNLARCYPLLFANTVVGRYPSASGREDLVSDTIYYQSLLKQMRSLPAQRLLYADKKLYSSAECHASATGKTGYTGHVRNTEECKAKLYFSGECCFYGKDDPLRIVLSLLLDEGVPSLGHRRILLGKYSQVGVSIKEHSVYKFVSVLDLHY